MGTLLEAPCNVGRPQSPSPPFVCPTATVITEPHVRWLATIWYLEIRFLPCMEELKDLLLIAGHGSDKINP